MKKKLYDFSTSTAVIVLLAYAVIFTLSVFSLNENRWTSLSGLIVFGLFALSLVLLIIFYVLLAITVTEDRVIHRNQTILKKDLDLMLRPNYRYRYNEIIFRDKRVSYGGMTKKELKKFEMAIQYFPKYEQFLLDYLNIKEIRLWSVDRHERQKREEATGETED